MNPKNKYTTLLSSLLLSLLLAWGCSDDFRVHGVDDDGLCHLKVSLPTADYKTRGYGANQEPVNNDVVKESLIQNLFILAYDVKGVNNKIEKVNGEAITLTSDYKEFEVVLVPGSYRVYAVANVDEIEKKYKDGSLDALSEKDFLNLVMRYSSEILPAPKDNYGLPMLGILDSEKSGDVYKAEGGSAEGTIDMVFLCSKVRFTLLFDNTENSGGDDNVGFSNPAFGTKTITFTGVRAENVADKAYVAGDAVYDVLKLADVDGIGERAGLSVGYFAVDKDNLPQGVHCGYPEDIDEFMNMNSWTDKTDGNTTITNQGVACNTSLTLTPVANGVPLDPNKRAYQGVLYLPENMKGDSPTTLYFTADCDGAELEYEVTLPNPAGKQGEVSDEGNADNDDLLHGAGFAPHVEGALQRGHFYDLIGKVKGFGGKLDVTLSVMDWTIETLVYDLLVPYYLHLHETSVEVRAGENTVMWYESDATSLDIVSPKYNDTDLDLYVMDKETYYPDSLIITVNPKITADGSINEYDELHNYFYLKAGNLYKRISVTPLSLAPFLNVTPGTVTFDVREMIGSGVYEREQPIKIATNLPNVKVEYFDADASVWNDADGLVDVETGKLDIDGGLRDLPLKASGLNDGKEFWKHEQTLRLRFTALNEDGSIAKDDDTDEDLVKVVTVKTYPNNLDYKIHFYGKGWTHPHIYVYQCLELPNDAEATINGTPTKVGGMTVGAKVGTGVKDSDGNEIMDYVSALQYSFTGKIAFKGWDYNGINNNPKNGKGVIEAGFFLFEDNFNWAPEHDTQRIHYYFDRDFSADHREKVKKAELCAQCVGSNYAQFWPGIMMLKGDKVIDNADDTWWDFDLTGIATPGKALIMFADAHESTTGLRYPGAFEVGIPLFDFPNREGWLAIGYNNDQFVSFKPEFDELPSLKYRIYWPDGLNGYTGMNLWLDTKGAIHNQPYNTTPPLGYNNGWWYYDFSIDKIDVLNIQGRWNLNSGKQIYHQNYMRISLKDFVEVVEENGRRCYTIRDFKIGSGGIPSTTSKLPESCLKAGAKIRIKWKSNLYNYSSIHVWEQYIDGSGSDHTDWNTQANVIRDGDYNYFDFNLKNDTRFIGYIFHDPGKAGTGDIFLSDGELKYNFDSTIGRYVYTIE